MMNKLEYRIWLKSLFKVYLDKCDFKIPQETIDHAIDQIMITMADDKFNNKLIDKYSKEICLQLKDKTCLFLQLQALKQEMMDIRYVVTYITGYAEANKWIVPQEFKEILSSQM